MTQTLKRATDDYFYFQFLCNSPLSSLSTPKFYRLCISFLLFHLKEENNQIGIMELEKSTWHLCCPLFTGTRTLNE